MPCPSVPVGLIYMAFLCVVVGEILPQKYPNPVQFHSDFPCISLTSARPGLGLRVGIRPGEHSAVEDNVMASHKGRFAGAEPKNGFGDFHGFAEAADGMLSENALADSRIAKG